jgi:hypothetical protein
MRSVAVIVFIVVLARAVSAAEETPRDAPPQEEHNEAAGDLANKVQNPVSDLISVPFQENLDYEIGPFSARAAPSTSSR